ncbi:MAG: aldolase [Rhodobacterales bacterium CG2_30_65_12]|nr:MAG: aldolase [Rhodobacterales bacterium CG2_30_65_12]
MTTFDDRENAYESKFAHDAELNFKAEARCNKLLAVWAAEKLGKSKDEAAAYVKEVIKADFEEAGHEDVVRKVAGDLGGASSADEVRAKRAELIVLAREQVLSEA